MASLATFVPHGPWRAQISAPSTRESPVARNSTRCAAARSEWRRGGGRRWSPRPVPAPTLGRGPQDGAAAECSPTYSFALSQSIVRLHSTAEQLAAVAASEQASAAAPLPSRLQAVQLAHLGRPLPPHPVAAHGRGLYHEDTLMRLGALSSIDSSMCSSGSISDSEDEGGSGLPPAEAHLQRWQAEAAAGETPGFNLQQRLTVPDLADIAVLSWGGRTRGKWKAANQDAFAAAELDSTTSQPAALLVVCDGHGRGGEHASTAAARGLAEAVPQERSRLLQPGSSGGNGSGSGSAGSAGLPVAQEALIAAFQAVGASMQVGFRDCGTAAVACLLEPHCLTCVWTGDCRAVAGLVVGTTQGPAVLVHQLTRDHKPENPLEHARIVATGRGRVVQLREGQSHRLCGYEATSQSIALSRALGDAWATELGLTYEPDALSITLPNPARISADWAGSSSSSGGSSSSQHGAFDTVGSSIGSTDAEGEAASSSGSAASSSGGDASSSGKSARPARHVLVVASDGLWDMLSNEEAVGIALSCASPDEAAQALMQTTCRRWAAAFEGEFLDDITLAVAFLPA